MMNGQPQSAAPGRVAQAGTVTHLASQVVSLLTTRMPQDGAQPREALLDQLATAACAGTPQAFRSLLAEMRRARISLPALADVYIPEVARRLGALWLEDRMSWMDVSIGVGRMQGLLREVGATWIADHAGDTDSGTVLLVIPDREQHTLGAMVAMSQMRRCGVSVCLRIAPGIEELRALAAVRRFDGIMISVGTKEKLAEAGRTVRLVRSATGSDCPILVGGAVMERVEDPAALTGADFCANDIGSALEAIGLKIDVTRVLRRA